jgi:hypothetical protein
MLARLFDSSRSFWQQHAPGFLDTRARRDARLGAMAARFEAALTEVAPKPAYVLRVRILRARCPADLWQLRLDLFNAVAKSCGQSEAQARLHALDALFSHRGGPAYGLPRRSPHQ